MNVQGRRGIAWALRLIIDVILAANVVVLIFLPRIVSFLYGPVASALLLIEDKSFFLPFLYPAGVMTLVILVLAHLILQTIASDDTLFSTKNITYFRLVGIVSLLLAALFIIKCFFSLTILTVFCGGFFIVFGLVAFVLSEVFRRAHVVWEENKLTI